MNNKKIYNFSLDKCIENYKELKKAADNNLYILIKNVISKSLVNKIRRRINKDFNYNKDVRISGRHQFGRKNLHRLDCGEYGTSRFSRYFFYFPWNDNKEITFVHSKLLHLKNKICGTNYDIILGSKKKTNYSLFQIIQYPIGGGFMSKHRDPVRKEKNDTGYVIMLYLSTFGKDFKSGGAYIYNKKNKKLFVEKQLKSGDILIYKSNILHGVEGVDRNKKIILNKVNGRIVAAATINYFKK